MVIIFTKEARKDLKYWKKANNSVVQKRITELLKAIQLNPFEGIGNPEQLKHHLSGYWSRRINKEHRVVYRLMDDRIEVISLRFRY